MSAWVRDGLEQQGTVAGGLVLWLCGRTVGYLGQRIEAGAWQWLCRCYWTVAWESLPATAAQCRRDRESQVTVSGVLCEWEDASFTSLAGVIEFRCRHLWG